MPRLNKKILDIFPPKEGISLQDIISRPKETKGTGIVFQKSKSSRVDRPVLRHKNIGIFVVFVLLGIIGFGLYLKLLEVRIDIWPVTEKWDFREEIQVSANVSSIDLDSKTIPGKIIEDSQELSRQFDATGRADNEEKARGTIRVYNQYNLPQVLIAQTRFLSADGKLFRSRERISIPSGGYSDVAVEAAEAGEEYNIEPTKFSIPGLAGSPRYTAVYGESLASLAGGQTSQSSQVTSADIERSKESLRNILREGGSQKVRYKLTEDMVLFDGAILQEEGDIVSLVESGAKLAYFNVRGSLKSRALVFQKKDLEKLIRDFLAARLSEGKAYDQKSLTIQFTFKNIDWEAKRMNMEVSFSSHLYSLIDLEDTKKTVLGMKPQEAYGAIANDPRIDRAKIKFWPLPAAKIPRNGEKIKIDLRLD